MEVILQQEVLSLGREGDIINVADGFANNYLIPKGIAVLATPGNLKQLEAKRSSLEKKEAAARVEAEKTAAGVEGKTIKLKVRVGEEGKLFGSVTAKDIAEAVTGQLKVDIDRRQVIIDEPIKEAGSYQIKIKFHFDVDAVVNVEVAAAEQKSPE